MVMFNKIIAQSVKLLERYPWVIPAFGFISGVASFFLVERKQDQFAQILSVLMLVGWLWLSLEKLLRRGISHWFNINLSPSLLRFFSQLLHQESLFFVIPFFAVTTSWNSAQLIFTLLLMVSALVSIIDPLYYKWLAPRRWLYFIFHGITLFAVLLVALPLIFQLPTPKSYMWALGIAVLLSFPGVVSGMTLSGWKRIPLIVSLLLVTGAVGMWARPWIPPASIWLTQVAITDHVDDQTRSVQNQLHVVTQQQLREGIYAYTAIHAPRGLHERIYHQWRHQGKLLDKIALDISGGREEGYRAWTHKRNFPENSLGPWQIYVMTEANQVIGILRFEVVDSHQSTTPAAQPESQSELEPVPGSEAIPENQAQPDLDAAPASEAVPEPESAPDEILQSSEATAVQ